MDVRHVKLLLDSCQTAARLDTLLPELPNGVTPRCIRVIEQINLLTENSARARVSDISERLDVTRPGITAVINQLSEMGYVTKERDSKDNRVVYVSLTEKGRMLWQHNILDYHQHLTEVLSEIGDDGVEQLAKTISRVVSLINEDTQKHHKE